MSKKHDCFALYQAWWSDAGSRLAPGTCRQYRYHVLRTLADLGKDPLTLTSDTLAKYLREFRPQHAKVIRGALLEFFGFLKRKGFRASNPIEQIADSRRARVRIKRGLTEEELVRLLVAAVWTSRPRFTGLRIAWLILAQYSLGLRPGELVKLTPEVINLDGDASSVEIRETKTGVDRVVPISPLAREALTELMAGGNGGISLAGMGRTNYWERVRRAAIWAEIPLEKCRPYTLRHSFATHLAQRGVRVTVIAELLGHTNLRHTMGYMTGSDEELKRAVGQLGR
jgi:integrase/recombinase XerD